jgi:hypothetical protein
MVKISTARILRFDSVATRLSVHVSLCLTLEAVPSSLHGLVRVKPFPSRKGGKAVRGLTSPADYVL